MNRKFWIIFGSVHLAIVAVFLAVYFLLPAPLSEEAASVPETAAPAVESTSEAVKLKLDLAFDSVDDLKWLGFWDYSESQEHAQEDTWEDGFVHLGAGNTFGSLGVNYSLEPGQIVHIRTRAGENTCYSNWIGVDMHGSSKEISLGGCTGGIFQVSADQNSSDGNVFGSMPLSGSVPAFAGEWMDKIIWLNETGDQLYYVITNTDDPSNVMFGAVELPEDWQHDRWGIGVNGYFETWENGQTSNYVDVDLIRVGTGSLLSYLSEYVPAYQENQEEFADLFAQEPEPMPELHPEGWQEQAEDMGGEDMGMAADTGEDQVDEPSMEVTENQQTTIERFGVLTWPDPAGFVPYLAKLEDIAVCNNCESVVYGVRLTPTGYVFMVTHGTPEDTRPPGQNTMVKHWIEVHTDTVKQDDYLFMADIYHYRIPAFSAGEPIQLIAPASAATHLVLIKANVVMNVDVNNAGKNSRIANQIITDYFALVPEDGFETPELVAEPSLAFNQELADQVIERVWVGQFEAEETEIDAFEHGSNFWVRLKAPVEKLEVAVYHEESQTYLSYFWMDNPSVGIKLPMLSEIPDGYYASYNDGNNYLIRVWADGELVAELQVRRP